MIEYLKNLSLYSIVAALAYFISDAIDSRYLSDFLEDNLITILIALLAINNTTFSVVMTKLREISDKRGASFSETIKEFRKSNLEQVFFILAAILLLVARDSEALEACDVILKVADIGLIAIFIASIHNLYDTGDSIFVILSFEKNN